MKNIIYKLFFNIAYFRKPPWDTGISPPELLDFIRTNPPGKALDLGCGTGTNVITLAKSGWQVTGVDFARLAIRMAHEKARRAGFNVKLLIDDVIQLKRVNDKFDLILDIGCYHSIDSHLATSYAQNIKRLLSFRGTYLLYGFTPPETASPGLTKEHLVALSSVLQLINQWDGSDRNRPSAWFVYQHTHQLF
jgi:cyclopropane fatty-acyl-phospholipid synthase-like methyltransferase